MAISFSNPRFYGQIGAIAKAICGDDDDPALFEQALDRRGAGPVKSDPRISNRQAWQVGLASLPDAVNARRMILPDANVRSLVAAAFGVDRGLGLLIETVAVTGARLSQLARLTVRRLAGELQPISNFWQNEPKLNLGAGV